MGVKLFYCVYLALSILNIYSILCLIQSCLQRVDGVDGSPSVFYSSFQIIRAASTSLFHRWLTGEKLEVTVLRVDLCVNEHVFF